MTGGLSGNEPYLRAMHLDGIIQKGRIFTQIQVPFHGNHVFHVLV